MPKTEKTFYLSQFNKKDNDYSDRIGECTSDDTVAVDYLPKDFAKIKFKFKADNEAPRRSEMHRFNLHSYAPAKSFKNLKRLGEYLLKNSRVGYMNMPGGKGDLYLLGPPPEPPSESFVRTIEVRDPREEAANPTSRNALVARVALCDASEWMVGRDRSADVLITGGTVSRLHAKLAVVGGDAVVAGDLLSGRTRRLFLFDNHSSNGTTILGAVPRKLNPHTGEAGGFCLLENLDAPLSELHTRGPIPIAFGPSADSIFNLWISVGPRPKPKPIDPNADRRLALVDTRVGKRMAFKQRGLHGEYEHAPATVEEFLAHNDPFALGPVDDHGGELGRPPASKFAFNASMVPEEASMPQRRRPLPADPALAYRPGGGGGSSSGGGGTTSSTARKPSSSSSSSRGMKEPKERAPKERAPKEKKERAPRAEKASFAELAKKRAERQRQQRSSGREGGGDGGDDDDDFEDDDALLLLRRPAAKPMRKRTRAVSTALSGGMVAKETAKPPRLRRAGALESRRGQREKKERPPSSSSTAAAAAAAAAPAAPPPPSAGDGVGGDAIMASSGEGVVKTEHAAGVQEEGAVEMAVEPKPPLPPPPQQQEGGGGGGAPRDPSKPPRAKKRRVRPRGDGSDGGAAYDDDDDDDFIIETDDSLTTDSDDDDEKAVSYRIGKSRQLAKAFVERRVGPLLTPAEAAKELGYEDLSGRGISFTYGGGDDGFGKVDLAMRPEDHLPDDVEVVPHDALRAFNSGAARGWGVCCSVAIQKGQVVGGPVLGRLVSDDEFADRRFDKEYVFSFDDSVLERKREHADPVRYVDLREHATIHRLVNDEQHDPNLRLLYWPPQDVTTSPPALPRQIFLVARRTIPAETELTWDYGSLYHRHWLGAGEDGRGYYDEDEDDDDEYDDDESDADTEEELEWMTENWAQCDKCDKWRRLPPGVGYCAEALPDKWYCSYNPNTKRNSCEKPEERMVSGEIYEGEGGVEFGEEEDEDEDEEENEEEDVDDVEDVEDDDDDEEVPLSSRGGARSSTSGAKSATSSSSSRPQKAAAAEGTTDDGDVFKPPANFFLENQSESDDDEETLETKRRNRSEMKQKMREWREAREAAAAAAKGE